MADDVKVWVVEFADRRHYQMQYRDPVTGRKLTRSTKVPRTGRKKERNTAERVAGEWQAELLDGLFCSANRLTWEAFKQRYEDEKLATLADATGRAAHGVFGHLERIIAPRKLADVTTDSLSLFQSELRKEGMRETTLVGNLRHLRAALGWAKRRKLIRAVPEIDWPKRGKGHHKAMRGRPLVGEEFDRLILAVPKVRKKEPEKWARLLRGLWLGGLRLSEALALSWDEDAPITVWLRGRYPKLRIWAEAEKGHRDRLLPITPDFAELLLAVPEDDRHGLVFGITTSTKRVSRYISAIGKRARVVVNKADGKFASAHDLRRSFGTRWAMRVKPLTLRVLMRHASIETTLAYYVDEDADEIAAELWQGNTLCNNPPSDGVRAWPDNELKPL